MSSVQNSAREVAGAPTVIVQQLRRSFGETLALRGADLTAYAGEVHAVVGENGSGKSTLAKIVGGIIPADGGAASVLGVEAGNVRAARRIGVRLVVQEILVVEKATVLENLFLGEDGLVRSAMPRRRKVEIARQMLGKLVSGPIDLDAITEELPLSVRQWIVIARALIAEPQVLILDEATAALDRDGAVRLYELVREMAASGRTVIIVTHRIEELMGVVDRATVLRDGVTTGLLRRDEITEERLVRLMASEIEEERAEMARDRAPAGPPQLWLDRLQLMPGTQPIDLEVHAGEIMGVAALEGHGAQELLFAMAGVRPGLAGFVRVGSAEATTVVQSVKDAERAGVGYVSGDRRREGLFPNMSILDNFGMALYRTTRKRGLVDRRAVAAEYERQAKVLAIRARSGGDLIGSLSGGNQQKVLIARALARAPRVLVLNDPSRGVDIPTKRDLYELLHVHANAGLSVVFFSTEIEELLAVSDRVAVVRDGAIFAVLDGAASSQEVLAAMFGQDLDAPVHPAEGPR